MNTLMGGFVCSGASAGLGLPDCYGAFCAITGALSVALAIWLLPEPVVEAVPAGRAVPVRPRHRVR